MGKYNLRFGLVTTICTLFFSIITFGQSNAHEKIDLINIEYPEVYELANIVLALTEYGITDKWQVRNKVV